MKIRDLRHLLSTLPDDSDGWDVIFEDSTGSVYSVNSTYTDAEKRGMWLVQDEPNGFVGDHW